MKKESVFKVLTLSLVGIVFLVGLEAVLRIVSPPSPFSPLLPLHPENRMELHVNLRGVSPVAFHSTNSWGMRGPEPPRDWDARYTIITVGGSTTMCFYLDDRKTWPYRLGEKLRDTYPDVWVGNGGLDGHTTRAHIIFMDAIVTRLRPKAVVVLVGANDLGFSISKELRQWGNPYDSTHAGWRYRAFASSRLLQVLYIWKKILVERATVVKSTGHGNFVPTPIAPEQQHLDGKPLPSDSKLLLPALPEYRSNIRRIVQLAKASNVRVLFLTQPTLFDDTEYWRRIEGTFYWMGETRAKLSAATQKTLLDIYNEELIETCKAERAECFDLAPLVPHEERYFYDGFHLTELGAELVAEQVAGYFRRTATSQHDRESMGF